VDDAAAAGRDAAAARRTGRSRWERVDAGDGVVLRRVLPQDAAGVLAVHGDPRVYELDPDLTHTDLATSAAFLEPLVAHWEEHGFGFWSVLVPTTWWPGGAPAPLPDDGDRVVAGMGGIRHHVLVGEPVLNAYYRLSPEVQGRGLAGRVLAACTSMAPEVAPGTDLVVRTRPANAAARRVAERAGFVDLGLEPGDPGMQLLRLAAPAGEHPDERRP
jgi:RimJ/RimL family protein N-acetyltransferase